MTSPQAEDGMTDRATAREEVVNEVLDILEAHQGEWGEYYNGYQAVWNAIRALTRGQLPALPSNNIAASLEVTVPVTVQNLASMAMERIRHNFRVGSKIDISDCENLFSAYSIAMEHAALSRPLPVTEGWHDIGTAPTGTLLLFADMKANEVRNWAFTDWLADGSLVLQPRRKPTHWAHVPEYPRAAPTVKERG